MKFGCKYCGGKPEIRCVLKSGYYNYYLNCKDCCNYNPELFAVKKKKELKTIKYILTIWRKKNAA